ncbi:hypothetical protein KY284_005030 [Solanum tuberosum]|uniref:Uncharacterized protein n=1 Tax=Solanum tuberosum TaxID=4113 RepID=M1BPH0_SOLTU|nr:hypothetical protein KY284_005030 [Solanum tuberosum]
MMDKSAMKTQKSVSRNPNTSQLASLSPKNKIRQRKFVIAKKKKSNRDYVNASMICKCNKVGVEKKKCLCVAYETLRASQEEFFKNRGGNEQEEENEVEKLDRDGKSLIPRVQIVTRCLGDLTVRHNQVVEAADPERKKEGEASKRRNRDEMGVSKKEKLKRCGVRRRRKRWCK